MVKFESQGHLSFPWMGQKFSKFSEFWEIWCITEAWIRVIVRYALLHVPPWYCGNMLVSDTRDSWFEYSFYKNIIQIL